MSNGIPAWRLIALRETAETTADLLVFNEAKCDLLTPQKSSHQPPKFAIL